MNPYALTLRPLTLAMRADSNRHLLAAARPLYR